MIDRKLEIFRMAAMVGSFTEAAAALGMSQPNVTHQLARLEEELGVRLFLRDGRTVRLTAAGKELCVQCEELFAESEKILRAVQCAAAKLSYHCIGGTMTAGGYLLPGLVAAYMNSHPGHRLGLQIANTREISGQLIARKLDLALVEGPFEPDSFLAEEFCSDELLPVFAPGTCPPEFSLAEYIGRGGRLILREEGSGTRYYFDRFLRECGVTPPGVQELLEVNSFDAVKLLVREKIGITVISHLAVRDELASGVLECGRFAEGRIFRKLNFLQLPGGDLNFAGNFIRFCRRQPVPGIGLP